MPKPAFKVRDRVTVVASPPLRFAAGVRGELGTKKLSQGMVGKVYTVTGFGEHGNVELWPQRLNVVWIEPEFLKLRAKKKTKRRTA
jgi:hypothetical protein